MHKKDWGKPWQAGCWQTPSFSLDKPVMLFPAWVQQAVCLPEPLLLPVMVKVDRVLIVATSREVLGDTAIKTGAWCTILQTTSLGMLQAPVVAIAFQA